MKRRLLYVLHCLNNRAGTEAHTKALRKGLASSFEVFVVFPERGRIVLLSPDDRSVSFPGWLPQWPMTPLQDKTCDDSLEKVLLAAKPDLIHVQHFHNWPLGIIKSLSARNLPVVASFHDYYAFTPVFTGQGARSPFVEPVDCLTADYSLEIFGKDISAYIRERADFLRESFQGVQERVVPSAFLARVFERSWRFKTSVIEHGIPESAAAAKLPDNGVIRFAYLGSLIQQKGWAQLLAAFAELSKQGENARLDFYGGTAPAGLASPPAVSFHGVYEQEDIPRILSGVDVGVIPSVFTETYSLVLSELWMHSVPAAVSDIGALGDRVAGDRSGRKFKAGDVGSMVETLRWFCREDAWRSWKIARPRTLPAMLSDYRTLYGKHVA